jgi:hypothetical protein
MNHARASLFKAALLLVPRWSKSAQVFNMNAGSHDPVQDADHAIHIE